MSERALKTCFGRNWIERGVVAVDLQDNALVVARRKIYLHPGRARILAVILENTRNDQALSIRTASLSLGYANERVFTRALQGLWASLENMVIANEGGLDSAFEYPTIYASKLFQCHNDRIEFNAVLADCISCENLISEEALYRFGL